MKDDVDLQGFGPSGLSPSDKAKRVIESVRVMTVVGGEVHFWSVLSNSKRNVSSRSFACRCSSGFPLDCDRTAATGARLLLRMWKLDCGIPTDSDSGGLPATTDCEHDT